MDNSIDSKATTAPETSSKREKICSIILYSPHESRHSLKSITIFVVQTVYRNSKGSWHAPIIRGHVVLIPSNITPATFLVVEVFDIVIKVTMETRSSSGNSASSGKPCICHDAFSDLEKVLHTMRLGFSGFRFCRGKSALSLGTTLKEISTEDYFKIESLVGQMSIDREAMCEFVGRTTTGDISGRTGVAINGVLTDEDILTEINQIKLPIQKTLQEFQILAREMKRKVEAPPIQNKSSKLPLENVKSKKITSRILPILLVYIAERLTLSDWSSLRDLILVYLPARTLDNVPNGRVVFNELVKRNIIGDDNIDFLRDALYNIERIDLVHIIDCAREGDFRLLGDQIDIDGNQADVPNDGMQDLTLNSDRYGANMDNSGGLGNQNNVSQQSPNDTNDPSSQAFSSAEDEPRTQSSNQLANSPLPGASSTGDTEERAGNNEAFPRQPQLSLVDPATENAEDNNDDIAVTEPNAEGSSTWVENPVAPCEHYERYCYCQFECCDPFWPCHRCHNARTTCGNTKLRSRDIKNIKCKRCNLVQEFPKRSPHCARCNLKLAVYFCAPCKHLTGNETNPFHCDKCGICRVHGDRSFHCDVCGVCLDIKLRDNHKCRKDSGHDACCYCDKDAFGGCQILPCSHKVHKQCAVLMSRNNISTCPKCADNSVRSITKGKPEDKK